MSDYTLLNQQLESLIRGVKHPVANLANASALLFDSLPDLNWAGFYLLENGQLVLGPFQGKVACLEIEIGKGVCGTCVKEDKIQRVANVHLFPGHIACDGASNSEIVIPLHHQGKIWGVLDIDSPLMNRFSEEDQARLEDFAKILEKHIIPSCADSSAG